MAKSTKSNDTKRQKLTDGKIDAARVRLAHALADPEDFGTMREKIKKAGVSHDTAYKWLKDPKFIAMVDEMVSHYTDAYIGDAWRAIIRNMRRGDSKAIDQYMTFKGKYKPTVKIEGETTTNVNIAKLEGLSDKDLEAIAYGEFDQRRTEDNPETSED